MTPNRSTIAALTASLLLPAAHAASLRVTLAQDLDSARPSETVTIPWTEVNAALPGALIQKIAVRDASGKAVPYQVTNVAPLAKDPKNVGAAYGELIFQHSFKAGEKSATYTIETTDTVSPVFPSQAFARYVPERLDDFAWENDKIGHRTYGPALMAPAPPGSGKEVLETSGLDIWFKRVPYPIVDRWYNKGHDHYHHDEGEGMDMYNVGKSRGAGGTGIWDGKQLYVSKNYAGWKVLANGPVRAIFELRYDAWDAAGIQVTEVKRFTVDAGRYLDQIDSTFEFKGPDTLTVAVGLNKTPADKGQSAVVDVKRDKANGTLLQWVEQKSNGAFGTAVILPTAQDFVDDPLNNLALAKVKSGQPLRYYVGGAWSRAGEITTAAQWQAYVLDAAKRAAHPVKVSLQAQP
jgi:pectinesterase